MPKGNDRQRLIIKLIPDYDAGPRYPGLVDVLLLDIVSGAWIESEVMMEKVVNALKEIISSLSGILGYEVAKLIKEMLFSRVGIENRPTH